MFIFIWPLPLVAGYAAVPRITRLIQTALNVTAAFSLLCLVQVFSVSESVPCSHCYELRCNK